MYFFVKAIAVCVYRQMYAAEKQAIFRYFCLEWWLDDNGENKFP